MTRAGFLLERLRQGPRDSHSTVQMIFEDRVSTDVPVQLNGPYTSLYERVPGDGVERIIKIEIPPCQSSKKFDNYRRRSLYFLEPVGQLNSLEQRPNVRTLYRTKKPYCQVVFVMFLRGLSSCLLETCRNDISSP